jgi:uncharacterized protein (DUF983 family)
VRNSRDFPSRVLYVSYMSNPRCPECGERVRFAPRLFGLPYCTKCGRRLQDAENTSKALAFLMPMFGVLSLPLFFRTIILGWPIALNCLFLACFVLWPCIFGAFSYLDYAKIIVAEPQTVPAKPEDWILHASAEYQQWRRLSVPRPVGISWKGWVRIAFGAVTLFVISHFLFVPWITTGVEPHLLQRLRGNALPIGVLLAIGGWANFSLIRQYWTDLPLLRSGNAVIGRVTQQEYQTIRIGTGQIGRSSSVEYEFRDLQGASIQGQGQDYMKSLFQDSPVLVFYKAGDPWCNVALGCSLYRLKSHS